MTADEALKVVHSYAASYGVPWVGVAQKWTTRAWWYFHVLAYHFDIDTGGVGNALATVDTRRKAVQSFLFQPKGPDRFWLPLWVAFPFYDSVTIGWRMGDGERYRVDWCNWFNSINADRQNDYKQRFPEPNRDGWLGFYERQTDSRFS